MREGSTITYFTKSGMSKGFIITFSARGSIPEIPKYVILDYLGPVHLAPHMQIRNCLRRWAYRVASKNTLESRISKKEPYKNTPELRISEIVHKSTQESRNSEEATCAKAPESRFL